MKIHKKTANFTVLDDKSPLNALKYRFSQFFKVGYFSPIYQSEPLPQVTLTLPRCKPAMIMSGFFIAVHAACIRQDALQGFGRNDLLRKPDPLAVGSEKDSHVEWPSGKDTWQFEKVSELSKFSRKRLICGSIRSVLFLLEGLYQEIDLSLFDIPSVMYNYFLYGFPHNTTVIIK